MSDYRVLIERARELAALLVPCMTKDLLKEQVAAIEALAAERDALREDAERWRILYEFSSDNEIAEHLANAAALIAYQSQVPIIGANMSITEMLDAALAAREATNPADK